MPPAVHSRHLARRGEGAASLCWCKGPCATLLLAPTGGRRDQAHSQSQYPGEGGRSRDQTSPVASSWGLAIFRTRRSQAELPQRTCRLAAACSFNRFPAPPAAPAASCQPQLTTAASWVPRCHRTAPACHPGTPASSTAVAACHMAAPAPHVPLLPRAENHPAGLPETAFSRAPLCSASARRAAPPSSRVCVLYAKRCCCC